MSTVLDKPTITPDEFLSLPDSIAYELVNGELVERNIGWESSFIGGRLLAILGVYCFQHKLGWVANSEGSYRCYSDDPNKVRRPDVSFIARGRLPGGRLPKGHCRIAPDLVGEVVSPNDLYSEVEEKVAEYLEAGVRLVWIVDPPTKTVRAHRADGSTVTLQETDELNGEDVVPGFRCQVAELFDDGLGNDAG